MQVIINWLKSAKNLHMYNYKKIKAYEAIQTALHGRFTVKQVENKLAYFIKKFKTAKALTKQTGWGVDGDATSIIGMHVSHF